MTFIAALIIIPIPFTFSITSISPPQILIAAIFFSPPLLIITSFSIILFQYSFYPFLSPIFLILFFLLPLELELELMLLFFMLVLISQLKLKPELKLMPILTI
jgi:hypothetical protein